MWCRCCSSAKRESAWSGHFFQLATLHWSLVRSRLNIVAFPGLLDSCAHLDLNEAKVVGPDWVETDGDRQKLYNIYTSSDSMHRPFFPFCQSKVAKKKNYTILSSGNFGIYFKCCHWLLVCTYEIKVS